MNAARDTRAGGGVRYGIAFALIAGLLLLQPLCTSTYLKLFYGRSDQLIQPVVTGDLPIPRSLAWSPGTVTFIQQLGALPLAGVLGWNIALVCLLLYGVVRILNPTFKMTTGVDWDSSILHRTYMHTQPLIKAFLILVSAALPAILLWYVLGLVFGDRPWVLLLRMCITGALVFTLMSRDGVAGDFDSGNYQTPLGKSLKSQVARGAAAGALGAITVLFGPMDPAELYFRFFRALGAIGEGTWLVILGASLAFVGAMAFSWAGLLVALGTPGWTAQVRWRNGMPYLVLLSAVLLGWSAFQPRYLSSRFDYEPTSGVPVAERLRSRVAGDSAAPVPQQALMIWGEEATPMRFSGESASGLSGSPEQARRVEDFLRKRDYRSAVAVPAHVTLIDAAALRWSPDDVLQAAMANIERSPYPEFIKVLLDTLVVCPATPAALSIADRFASDALSHYPSRRAPVEMGDLLARLGRRAQAERLYRKARMPQSQVVERAMERTMFAEGEVRGRIRWNGGPVAGMKVGLIPAQSLPSLRLLTTPSGETSPAALRLLAGSGRTTDQGVFEIRNVVAGVYVLLVEAPLKESIKAGDVQVSGAPRRIIVSFASKRTDLGAIDLKRARTADQALQTSP